MTHETLTIKVGHLAANLRVENGVFHCTPEWLVAMHKDFPDSKNPNYREGDIGLELTTKQLRETFNVEEES